MEKKQRDALYDESKRMEEDCIYSLKSHYEMENFWTYVHWGVGGPAAVISAIAGISILSSEDTQFFSAILAIFAAAMTGIITFFNPNDKAHQNKETASQYLALRNELRIFYNIELESSDFVTLKSKLSQLNFRKNEINKASPNIFRFIYKKVQNQIANGEAEYSH